MSTARLLDQFYTKPHVAQICLDFFHDYLADQGGTFYVEPSAGEGAFFGLLPVERRLGLDIEPRFAGVEAGNFLDSDLSEHVKGWRHIVFIGNPPFGKKSALALKFINHAAVFASHIAFILPRTFKKDSIVKKINPFFHLERELTLTDEAFLFEGKSYDVPCVFQIWVKKDFTRPVVDLTTVHEDFSFVAPAQADFAVRRVGGLAGKIIEDFSNYAPASHYFLKCSRPDEVKKVLAVIPWDRVRLNTAGNPSIGKREMIALYEEVKQNLSNS